VIIDASALVAIVRGEPDARRCVDLIFEARDRYISAANLLEAYLVIDGARIPEESAALDATIHDMELAVVPVDRAQVEMARDAYRRFGKGSGHGARLNFGDCFAYALARSRDEPLLFIGNDFAQTDITPAL
jgi:ribonuclease VapC